MCISDLLLYIENVGSASLVESANTSKNPYVIVSMLEKGNPDLMRIRNPNAIPNRNSKDPQDYMWNQKLRETECKKQ